MEHQQQLAGKPAMCHLAAVEQMGSVSDKKVSGSNTCMHTATQHSKILSKPQNSGRYKKKSFGKTRLK